MVELLNFCLNSELKPVMHFFNKAMAAGSGFPAEVKESLFQTDFVE